MVIITLNTYWTRLRPIFNIIILLWSIVGIAVGGAHFCLSSIIILILVEAKSKKCFSFSLHFRLLQINIIILKKCYLGSNFKYSPRPLVLVIKRTCIQAIYSKPNQYTKLPHHITCVEFRSMISRISRLGCHVIDKSI